MSQHTKGPWSVLDNRRNKTGNGGVHIVAGGAKIARVLYRSVDPLGEAEAERMANARMFAAASDLFKALDELLTDMMIAQGNMRDAAKHDPRWEGCAEAIQPRVTAARAAIAKARGES